MEHKVKSYQRRTKSGKMVTVRAHSRRGKLTPGERSAAYHRERGNLKKAAGAELIGRLERKSKDSKYDNMTYREAVRAGAPKLSPNVEGGGRGPLRFARISGDMKYSNARKKGYVTQKNIRKRAKEKA